MLIIIYTHRRRKDLCMQAYGALEEVERALGVDPGNPIIPVILVVGGTLYLGYVQLNLCTKSLIGLVLINFVSG